MISSSSMTRIVPRREVGMALQVRLVPRASYRLFGWRRRQHHGEFRALSDHAVAANRAVVLADNAVGDGQAEAGAAADRLGGEERVVNPRQVRGWYPGSGVGDFR